jgi:hypothetical protein
MVANATYLELESPDGSRTAQAEIVAVDYEANLALLTVKSDEERPGFFEGTRPLPLAEAPVIGGELSIFQVEDNGTTLLTAGILQSVDVSESFLAGQGFLTYMVKASMQSAASSFSLPVLRDGKLAGMLLSYDAKDQICDVAATDIVSHFLTATDTGEYKGVPNLGIGFAQTLDETFREFTGIADSEGGIFVREMAKDGSADKAGIKEGDVILSIAGQPIDSRGNYTHPAYGKLSFSHLVRGGAKVGDTIKLDIIRDKKPMTVEVQLTRKPATDYLIDPYMFDRGPKDLIFGGLIFQELTLPYLESWGEDWTTRAPFKLVHANANPHPLEEEGREKLVFLSNVLKTPSTLGYEGINSVIVTKVNGTFIKNIKDLAAAFTAVTADGLHTIEFDDYPKVIYVDDRASRLINQQLIQYGIGQLERLE